MTKAAKQGLITTMNKKKPVQSKTPAPSKTNLAQTDKHKKSSSSSKVSKKTTNTTAHASVAKVAKKPPQKANVQQKSDVQLKSKDFAALLKNEQKKKLKGLRNPIDGIEQEVRAKLDPNNHAQADIAKFDKLAAELRAPAGDTFKRVFKEMNGFEQKEQHVGVHEEAARMRVDHKIRDEKYETSASVRKQKTGMGNQGIEHVQQAADIHLEEDVPAKSKENAEILKQIDLDGMFNKTAKASKLQKAAELVKASESVEKHQKDQPSCKQASCPKCKDCPVCQAQTISPLEELATHSNELTFQSADEKPEDIKLSIFPQDVRDFITKDVQVLNAERIVGYNTYNNILEKQHSKALNSDSNSDFYNVTVNFVMKRKPTIVAAGNREGKPAIVQKELPISVYENSIAEAEKINRERKAEQEADEANEPKVIMPSEIKIPPKDKSLHAILQESRISKEGGAEEDQAAVQTQETQTPTEGQEQPTEQAAATEETQTAQAQTEQKSAEAAQPEADQTPVELSNAQLEAQLESLSESEIMQLAQEAQAASVPPSASNLQLKDDVESSAAPAPTNATAVVQQPVVNQTKTLAAAVVATPASNSTGQPQTLASGNTTNSTATSQLSSEEMVQVKNSSSPVPEGATSREQQHLAFLNKVQQKAEQALKQEQKGVSQPITTNVKTQEMYSHARSEKADEAQASNNALSLQQSGEIDEMTVDEDEDPEVEELTVDASKVAHLQDPVSVAQQERRRHNRMDISLTFKNRKKSSKKGKGKKANKLDALTAKLQAGDP